jgi:hypothetical protein
VVLAVVWAGTPLDGGAQPLRGGVRFGPAFGFLNDSPIPFVSEPGVTKASTNVRIDLHVGGHLVVPVTERLSVQPELLFVQKGGHLSRTGTAVYAAERYRLSYVQAHLLGRRDIGLPGPLSMHVVAGATADVATGGVVRRDVRTPTRSAEARVRLLSHDVIRRWDVGALLGVGVGYPVGARGTLALELRYNPGFRTVFTGAGSPSDRQWDLLPTPPPLSRTPPPLRHDVILVAVSYTVPLRPK